ncbi:MAG: Rnf-Nqr domain containing protein [Pseudomonadota bacterium]
MTRLGVLGPLSLVPLLGASQSLVMALGLTLAAVPLVVLFCGSQALLQPWLHPRARLPAAVLLAAILASAAQLGIQTLSLELHRALGLYLPLLALHALLLACSGALLGRRPLGAAALGLRWAGGASAVLLLLALLREALGTGTLFAQLDWLFGPAAAHWQIHLLDRASAFGLATLLPGALILLGLLLAAKNRLAPPPATAPEPPVTSP